MNSNTFNTEDMTDVKTTTDLKVEDVFPLKEMLAELVLAENAKHSGTTGSWGDRKSWPMKELWDIKGEFQKIEETPVATALKTNVEAVWRAHEITKKLEIGSIKKFPGIETNGGEVLVSAEFKRTTVHSREQEKTKTLQKFIEIWLSHFFGPVDAFKHHTEKELDNPLQLRDFFYLALYDITYFKLHNAPTRTMEEESLYGLLNFETLTDDLRTQKPRCTYKNELAALRAYEEWRDLPKFSDIETLFCCGALCFIQVNKEGDTELDIDTFREKVTAKVKKDLQKIQQVEANPEATAKEKKGATVALTGIRTGQALLWLCSKLQSSCKVIIGTRGPDKVSVDNFKGSKLDIGSGMTQLALGGDIDTLKKIKDVAVQMYKEEKDTGETRLDAMGVTGGDYATRITSSDNIKKKISETFDLSDEELRAVMRFVQPIHGNVEKNSILTQRPLFSSETPHLLMQCGNRDALLAANGKIVAGISVDLSEDNVRELKEWAGSC